MYLLNLNITGLYIRDFYYLVNTLTFSKYTIKTVVLKKLIFI